MKRLFILGEVWQSERISRGEKVLYTSAMFIPVLFGLYFIYSHINVCG